MANVENETIQNTDSTSEPSEQDKKLANLVNSVVTSHFKRHMGKMTESFESLLTEKLSGFQLPTSQASVPDKKAEKSFEETEVSKLRAELAAEKRATLEKDTYSSLKEKLSGKVRPEAVGSVLKVLKADGHIDFSKKHGPVFKFDGEEYSLEEGLEVWLENSEDAKLFKPAPSGSVKKSPFKAPARKAAPTDTKSDPRAATIEQLTRLGLRL